MLAGLLTSMLAPAAITTTCLVIRAINRQTEAATHPVVVASPANEVEANPLPRATVNSVVALDDEMLIELLARCRHDTRTSTMWVHSPAKVASIITLTRWRDARVEIEVRPAPQGVVLGNDQARVALAHAQVHLAP